MYMKRGDTKAVNFRFPSDLVDQLEKDAKANFRNLSQEVIMRLYASYESGRRDVSASDDHDRTSDTEADNANYTPPESGDSPGS